jgi:hypothetical protein
VTPLRILGIALIGISVVRLGGLCRQYAAGSLQADFAAYYAAGESVKSGLSPYDNNLTADPPVWDGLARYHHSRFLYPPLVARMMVPLTWVSYAQAKIIWMMMTLAAVLASLIVTVRLPGKPLPREGFLIAGAFTLLFFPLTVLLERGQIDALTLLPLTAGFSLIATRPDREAAGGMLIGLACLIKPHIILVLPFLFLRGKWKAAGGLAAAGLVLAALSYVMAGGSDELTGYVRNELPRIGRYGELGTQEMLLPDSLIAAARGGLADDEVPNHGMIYRRSMVDFAPGASFVRLVSGVPKRLGLDIPLPLISLVLMLGAAGVVWWGQRRHASPHLITVREEFLFWQFVVVLLLIFGPLTWMMNLVWLLPAAVLLLAEISTLPRIAPRWSIVALGGGLVLASLPEAEFLASASLWLQTKYVLAEIAVLAGLWGMGAVSGVKSPR